MQWRNNTKEARKVKCLTYGNNRTHLYEELNLWYTYKRNVKYDRHSDEKNILSLRR